MTKLRSVTLALAGVAGIMLAVSPAFAWVCTAKNARGALYSAVGVFSAPTQALALAKCRANSVVPATCVIKACTP
jgi:hypothetical protein